MSITALLLLPQMHTSLAQDIPLRNSIAICRWTKVGLSTKRTKDAATDVSDEQHHRRIQDLLSDII